MKKNHPNQNDSQSHEKKTNENVTQTLESLRRQIDAIDQKMVSLLADRQKQIEQVVTLKKTHHLPIYHPAREEDLITDRRNQAQQAGLNPDYFEELFRLIIRHSRVEQAAKLARKGIRPEATVLLVGGEGSMGQYFYRWFEDAGYTVRILDRGDWDNAETLCKGIDLAMICVPIEVTVEVISKIAKLLAPHCVLADITSVKVSPLKAMLAAHNGPVIGLHPLFGATTSTLDKQIIVATPGRKNPDCQWIIDQFTTWGAITVHASAQEHDDIMGVVQTLRHFATFAFGQFLSRRRIDLHRTLEFSSPIYRLELGMVGRLFTQDPSLYAEIILASPERRKILKDYLDSINENFHMIEVGDREIFCDEFKRIAEWFGPFSEQAMRESTYLIDKLIERF